MTGSRVSAYDGELLTAISTRIVSLMREHYWRGPTRAKTYAFDDLVICVLRDEGAIPVEQTLMEKGDSDRVLELRRDFQRLMGERYKAEGRFLAMHAVLCHWGRIVDALVTVSPLRPEYTRALLDEFRKVGRTTLAGTLLLVLVAAAQQTKSIKVDVDLVQVYATVTDPQGHYVVGLEPENFQIAEDKVDHLHVRIWCQP